MVVGQELLATSIIGSGLSRVIESSTSVGDRAAIIRSQRTRLDHGHHQHMRDPDDPWPPRLQALVMTWGA